MKNNSIVNSDNMARHLWEHSPDRTVKVVCANAINGDASARADVLRTYIKLTLEHTSPFLAQHRRPA